MPGAITRHRRISCIRGRRREVWGGGGVLGRGGGGGRVSGACGGGGGGGREKRAPRTGRRGKGAFRKPATSGCRGRFPGTAVFLASAADGVPLALTQFI